MTRSSRRVRTVVVDGVPFVWSVAHKHHVLPASSPGTGTGRCREVFSAYLKGKRTGPLRVWFTASEGRGAGYPAAGVAWVSDGARLVDINLNTPGVAAAIVREALKRGWSPGASRAPVLLEAGFELVADFPEHLRNG
jgi:hypothetical protein